MNGFGRLGLVAAGLVLAAGAEAQTPDERVLTVTIADLDRDHLDFMTGWDRGSWDLLERGRDGVTFYALTPVAPELTSTTWFFRERSVVRRASPVGTSSRRSARGGFRRGTDGAARAGEDAGAPWGDAPRTRRIPRKLGKPAPRAPAAGGFGRARPAPFRAAPRDRRAAPPRPRAPGSRTGAGSRPRQATPRRPAAGSRGGPAPRRPNRR